LQLLKANALDDQLARRIEVLAAACPAPAGPDRTLTPCAPLQAYKTVAADSAKA
tara:strand:- start:170 stop:331 length:162 start_codon:yes stop_codon:yes gene_type:complete